MAIPEINRPKDFIFNNNKNLRQIPADSKTILYSRLHEPNELVFIPESRHDLKAICGKSVRILARTSSTPSLHYFYNSSTNNYKPIYMREYLIGVVLPDGKYMTVYL